MPRSAIAAPGMGGRLTIGQCIDQDRDPGDVAGEEPGDVVDGREGHDPVDGVAVLVGRYPTRPQQAAGIRAGAARVRPDREGGHAFGHGHRATRRGAAGDQADVPLER